MRLGVVSGTALSGGVMPELDLIEPNEAELKAGWTAEKLTRYVHERRAAEAKAIAGPRQKPVVVTSAGYRWRFPVRGRR